MVKNLQPLMQSHMVVPAGKVTELKALSGELC